MAPQKFGLFNFNNNGSFQALKKFKIRTNNSNS